MRMATALFWHGESSVPNMTLLESRTTVTQLPPYSYPNVFGFNRHDSGDQSYLALVSQHP